jgi:pimeloyl-ACP methyl ester carboxylesterase
MVHPRKYGNPPYKIALIHGGPGAPGEMAPVACELASEYGILEPIQTEDTLEGQVEELREILENHADPRSTLVGYSWGAWLSFMIAARYSSLIKKLILVSSGPFEIQYAVDIMETRRKRLTEIERIELTDLMEKLHDATTRDKDTTFARVGELIHKADSYDPIPQDDEVIETQYRIFQNVWNAAEELRASGKLLQLAAKINCPVTAIHGDYDPHPAEGVRKPLSNMLENIRFILIKNCGHTPWVERQARDVFFRVLREELNT